MLSAPLQSVILTPTKNKRCAYEQFIKQEAPNAHVTVTEADLPDALQIQQRGPDGVVGELRPALPGLAHRVGHPHADAQGQELHQALARQRPLARGREPVAVHARLEAAEALLDRPAVLVAPVGLRRVGHRVRDQQEHADDFVPENDPLEVEFKELMAVIKEKRAAQAAEVEAERQANLEKKLAIIEKIKEMVANPDSIDKNYEAFSVKTVMFFFAWVYGSTMKWVVP